MNRFAIYFSFFLLGAPFALAQTFTSSDTPLPVPLAGTSGSTTSTIPIPNGLGTILDVNVGVNISHTFSGDLELRISSPLGTTVQLFDNEGGGVDAAPGTIFDDEALTPIGANPLGPGSFIPFEPLSAFDGEDPGGDWTLQVDDLFGGDSGSLFDWSLILQLEPPAAAPTPTPTPRPTPVPRFLLIDAGAINSARATGGLLPNTLAQNLRQAPQTALRDVNKRLFRYRAAAGNPRSNGDTLANADRNLGRYLNFARGNGMNLRQALGLEGVPASLSVKDGAPSLSSVFSVEKEAGGKAILQSPSRWEVFGAADASFHDQNRLPNLPAGYESNTYTGSVGAEYLVNSNLNLGFAWSYLDHQTDLDNGLGGVDIEGNLVSMYGSYFRNSNYFDLLYSYGFFENDLTRNTLLPTLGFARGNTDSDAHILSFNAGRNINFGNGLVMGPILGLDYTDGEIEGYRERGAGRANLNYLRRDYESLISEAGWQISSTREVNRGWLTLQGRASWGHEFSPEADALRASLATSPFTLVNGANVRQIGGFNLNIPGAQPGDNWLNLGVGARLLTHGGVGIHVDYQTEVFRQNQISHYVGAKISAQF